MAFKANPTLVIVGLGYVGLPLAVVLAKHFKVTGFDINKERIEELKQGFDKTQEVDRETLAQSSLILSHDESDILNQDIYIVTVPTPVTETNLPDLSILERASAMVGKVLQAGSIVVYESTVYPGVTEEICGPILEKTSKLKMNQDFYLGYSPERINPGDKKHTVAQITKVVSGQNEAVAEQLKMIYGKINNNNIFVAKNIKTAEAAKVIENAQRDINIAFINEIATIMGKLNLSIYDVLEAAQTKWNFLKFQPGLVGGHCIGVDPYYLAYCARQLQHEPEVILAGRRINENMGVFLAHTIQQELEKIGYQNRTARILVLGLTFKEDIPDLRNSKVIDLIQTLKQKGHQVDVHDAMADKSEAFDYYGIELLSDLNTVGDYDCLIGAVPHQSYLQFEPENFQNLTSPSALVADIKNMWRTLKLPDGLHYWSL